MNFREKVEKYFSYAENKAQLTRFRAARRLVKSEPDRYRLRVNMLTETLILEETMDTVPQHNSFIESWPWVGIRKRAEQSYFDW